MAKWAMVIDLKKCVNCYACTIACKQENFLPPGIFWNRLLIGEEGSFPNARKITYPVLCNHCGTPVCVDVCPVEATYQGEDGIVEVDPDKCIGCQNCVLACPFQQRVFLSEAQAKKEYFPGQGLTELEIIGKTLNPLTPGTVVKCNFCREKIDEGLAKGLKPGIDQRATPACVTTCMTKARHFGNMDDPESNVSVLIRERNGFVLRPELGTQPSVYYVK
jgi:molybdopterin-containing oxidoreductase family iron-sulfur binding subunit